MLNSLLWLALLSLAVTGVVVFGTTYEWAIAKDTTAEAKLGRWTIPVCLMSLFMTVFCVICTIAILTYKFS